MPNPTVSDVHINRALTNVSIAYYQDASMFLADKVFPTVPSEHRSDSYFKYSKSDFRRTDAQKRAPGTESAGINWTVNADQFYADVYAAHKDIDDQTRANADSNFNLDSDATRLVTQHLLLQRDIIWAQRYFGTGIWGTEYTGVGSGPTGTQFLQWNLSGSDPLANFTKWKTAFLLSTGYKPNFIVLGADVWDALVNHPAILDRIKYTQKGVVTEELVAQFFGVEKLYVAHASVSTGPNIPDAKAQDAAATFSFIANSKSILFGYAPANPSVLVPSAGYTFTWKGYGAGNKQGLTIQQFRMQQIKSNRIEGEAAYDMKVVAADCGVFVNTAVS